jgi:hypothetical protein
VLTILLLVPGDVLSGVVVNCFMAALILGWPPAEAARSVDSELTGISLPVMTRPSRGRTCHGSHIRDVPSRRFFADGHPVNRISPNPVWSQRYE